jgi:hypothetical protein
MLEKLEDSFTTEDGKAEKKYTDELTFIDLMLWCPTLDPATRGSDTSLRPLLASTLVYL